MCENCDVNEALVYEWGFETRSTPSSLMTFDITANAVSGVTGSPLQLNVEDFDEIANEERYAFSVRGQGSASGWWVGWGECRFECCTFTINKGDNQFTQLWHLLVNYRFYFYRYFFLSE